MSGSALWAAHGPKCSSCIWDKGWAQDSPPSSWFRGTGCLGETEKENGGKNIMAEVVGEKQVKSGKCLQREVLKGKVRENERKLEIASTKRIAGSPCSLFCISCNQDIIQSVTSSICASPLPHSASLYPGAASLTDQTFRQVRVAGRLQDMKKYLHIFIWFSMRSQSHGNMYYSLNQKMLVYIHTRIYLCTSISSSCRNRLLLSSPSYLTHNFS